MSNRAPILSALLLLSLALSLSAANPWPLPLFSSDPAAVIKAAAERPPKKTAAVILLDYHATFRFLPNGQIQRVNRMVYSVVNESGVNQLTKISASWLAWRTEKPTIRVRVVTHDGIAHVFDPKTITEAGVPSRVEGLYSDLKVLTAPLPSLGPGSVVEAEIVTDDRETVNPGGTLEQLPFSPGFPIQYLNVTLEAPAGVPLHVEERGLPQLAHRETAADGVRRLELSASDLNPDEPIPMAPPEAAGNPQLVISDVADWRQVAKWYSGVIERQIGVASPVVDANTDPASRLAEIDAILAGIQKEVRYTGVELGFAAIEPRKPSETLTRGYGDCKDKAALLVSRLRKAGIASTLALLTPYPAADVLPSVPGMEAFTHAIVYLPGKNPIWIDPTAEFAAARRLPWADHGRLALVVDSLTTALTRIPEDQAAGELTINTITMNLSESGKSAAQLVREDSGGIEDYIRPNYLAGLQASDSQREALMSQIQEQMAVGKVGSIDWGTPKDLAKPARITVTVGEFPNSGFNSQSVFADVGGLGESPMQLAAFLLELADEEAHPPAKERTQDYYLSGAFNAEQRSRVIPPKGFQLKQLPKVGDLTFGPLTIHRSVSLEEDGSVLFIYRSEGPRRFASAQAKSLQAAVNHTRVDSFHVEFMAAGTMLMSEGKWKQGMDQLRRDAESPSADAAVQLRYATALLEVGLRDEAIAVCRRAIAHDPKSSSAYARLSFFYRHDSSGRLDLAGKDLTESEKAIRKAIELDPGDKRLVVDLATILEWKNPDEQYADKEGVEQAVALLDGIAKDLPGLQEVNLLPTALFFARHFTELQSFYSRPDSAGARADLKIAGVAASETAAAALREAERMFPQEETRKSVVQAAGQFLMRIREYPKAADLLREGSGATSIPHSDFELLSRTRPASQIKLSSSGPVAVVQRYITALLDPQSKSGFASLLVPEWSNLTFIAQRNAMVTLLRPFSTVGGEALWTRALSDIVISNVEFVAEGSEATGYRVRYADPSQGGARKTVAWVVKRGDAFQILGLRGDQATTGGEALALANKGNILAARRWLDWERDEIAVVTRADPLALEPFLKLWPPQPEISERDQALAAAACLVARGRYYKQGVETLSAVRARALDHSFQSAIDFAWADGLRLNNEFADSLPLWGKMRQRYPASEVAFNAVGTAMVRSGRLDEALELAHGVKQEDPLYAPAQRIRARSLSMQHKYGEASRAYQAACESPKANAVDWNNRAWLTLFEPGTLRPDTDSANVALRLTQGRGSAEIHTMSAILAETGQLKEARQMLIRYMALFNDSEGNVSARYVVGRIAEGLGLADAATAIYTGIPRPKTSIGDDAYDLAQIRLRVMSPVK